MWPLKPFIHILPEANQNNKTQPPPLIHPTKEDTNKVGPFSSLLSFYLKNGATCK